MHFWSRDMYSLVCMQEFKSTKVQEVKTVDIRVQISLSLRITTSSRFDGNSNVPIFGKVGPQFNQLRSKLIDRILWIFG